MNDLNITLIQSHLEWEERDTNLDSLSKMISQSEPNSDLIILPEMFATGFTMNVATCAEKMDGKAVSWLKDKAAETNAVVAGSLLIRENNKFYNRFLWMRPDGSFDYYDKRHLFRMAKEHETMTMGQQIKIVELKGWKINLQVCYDLRFPVWSHNRFTNGKYNYDMLIYVSNWPEVRNQAYKALLPARAIENQAWVAWVNRVGEDGNGIPHSGDSAVYDPYGKVHVVAREGNEEVVHTSVPGDLLPRFREKFKVGQDWDEFSVHDKI